MAAQRRGASRIVSRSLAYGAGVADRFRSLTRCQSDFEKRVPSQITCPRTFWVTDVGDA